MQPHRNPTTSRYDTPQSVLFRPLDHSHIIYRAHIIATAPVSYMPIIYLASRHDTTDLVCEVYQVGDHVVVLPSELLIDAPTAE